jgi:hypothetical protein
MKIDTFKDSFYIRFEERADNFAPIKTYPHHKQWIKVISFLKRRGFTVKTPKYFIENNYGKAEHKVAYRGNVVITLELMNWQIAVKYGDIKNLWKDWEFNFWSLTDDRSTQLTYLESKKVELEIKKLLSIFPKDIITNKDDSNLSNEDKILKDKRESCHSRDKSKLDELGLDGVVYQMSEYDFKENSTDKNKKQIQCGELKYYYDYKRRLKCGRVYHSLNNRWIVLMSDGLDYVSDWELFDFKGEPRRKELKKEEKINRLERELKRYESNKNYMRCISINKQIDKLKATEKVYNVWSLKWNKWWGANNSGYTEDKRYAGVYLESNILDNQSYYNNGISTKAVLIS